VPYPRDVKIFVRFDTVSQSTPYSPVEFTGKHGLSWKQIISEAFSWPVIRRSLMMAAIVGPLLICINHSSCLWKGEIGWDCVSRSLLTMLVPYSVATISSVHAAVEKINGRDGITQIR